MSLLKSVALSLAFAGLVTIPPVLAASLASSIQDTSQSVRSWQASGGWVQLRINVDLLRQYGVTVRGGAKSLARGEGTVFELRARTLDLKSAFGNLRSFDAGALRSTAGFSLLRGDQRIDLTWFELAADSENPQALALRDQRGRVWLVAERLMYVFDENASRLRMPTADLRIAPQLAAWIEYPEAAGMVVADLKLDTRLTALSPPPAVPKSCAVPVWHGQGGRSTDVLLEYIDVQQMRCRRSSSSQPCDGPSALGGSDDGEVVFAPTASLVNSDTPTTADVPWIEKFLVVDLTPPGNFDQHPYLIWNMYRIDAQGRLAQIGRSGVKHAFFSTNTNCNDPTCSGGRILGRACGDIYTTGSNDLIFYLAPRSEIIPARGIWGRCGSIWDDLPAGTPGCDGVQDYEDPPFSEVGYRYRLSVAESAIERPANDGARFLFDAWYVIRDDVNPYNSMGWVEVTPIWNGFQWNLVITPGTSFNLGTVLNAWVPSGSTGLDRHVELPTSEGRVRVAVRVRQSGDRWRYDYVVQNLEFAREVTQGAEPNLRIVDARGFAGVEVPLPQGGRVFALEHAPPGPAGSAAWNASGTSGTAPRDIVWAQLPGPAESLDWGNLARFSIVTDAAPVEGSLRLIPARAGSPANYAVSILIPGVPPLFADGFE